MYRETTERGTPNTRALARQVHERDGSVFVMRAGVLNRFRGPSMALALIGAWGCSTVEPGDDPKIAQVVYDEDFFYCQVEPKVLVAQSCSSGDPSKDASGGCHATATPFRVLALDPNDMVTCDANGRHTGSVPQVAQSNYGAAQAEMTPNAETAPFFTHPTQKTNHPRQIFDTSSMEAEIIRQWAQRSSR